MPGNYTCVNCGVEGYTYGSPIWVQTCKECRKPVGLEKPTPERVKGVLERKIPANYDSMWCEQLLVNCLKPGEAGLLTTVYLDTHDPLYVEVGDYVWAKLIKGKLGLPVSPTENGYYYVTQIRQKKDGKIRRPSYPRKG